MRSNSRVPENGVCRWARSKSACLRLATGGSFHSTAIKMGRMNSRLAGVEVLSDRHFSTRTIEGGATFRFPFAGERGFYLEPIKVFAPHTRIAVSSIDGFCIRTARRRIQLDAGVQCRRRVETPHHLFEFLTGPFRPCCLPSLCSPR